MAESVSQNLPANPIALVLKNRFYGSRRSFQGYAECRTAAVRSRNSRKFMPGSSEQMSQVAWSRRARAQILNGIPALDDGRRLLGASGTPRYGCDPWSVSQELLKVISSFGVEASLKAIEELS